jgi:hypothetical protein
MKPASRHRPFPDSLACKKATTGLVVVLFVVMSGCRRTSDQPSQSSRPPGGPASTVRAPDTPQAASESGNPAQLGPEELKLLLEGLPQSLLPDRADAQLARDLGIRAWVVEYTGGPIAEYWLEIEETGQQTMPKRKPEPPFVMACKAPTGRLLLGFRPGASKANPSVRSQQLLKRLSEQERYDGIAYEWRFGVIGDSMEHEGGTETTPRLWSGWHDVAIKELSRTATVKQGEAITLLAVEAVDQPENAAKPRKVKLVLKAKGPSQAK